MARYEIYRDFGLANISKALRKNMTHHEKHLWYDFLSKHPVRWYKQRVIDHCVVDFFCYKAKLAVELDGSQHYTEQGYEYDTERTKILERYGIQVLRFSNRDIDRNFENVCLTINKVLQERLGDGK